MNIVLCGFMGCGKSTIGKQLAKKLGINFVDTDEYVEQSENMKISEIFDKIGEDYFRNAEFEACKKFSQENNYVISTGGGALTFERNVNIFKDNSIIVFIDVPFDVICQRIGDCKTRPLFADKEKAQKLYNTRKNLYANVGDCIIDGNNSVHRVVKAIIDEIKLRQ